MIGFNEIGRVKVIATGEELPLMTGKGGMKEAFKLKAAAAAVSSATISAEDDSTFDR